VTRGRDAAGNEIFRWALRDVTEPNRLRLLAVEARDLGERYEEVSTARVRGQSLSRQLVEGQEIERRRIALLLHDEIGQVLTGLALMLDATLRSPCESDKATLLEARGEVAELIRRVRQLSLDLRPAMLDDFGLLAAISGHAERFGAQARLTIHVKHTNVGRRYPSDVETAAFRVVQEALTNVARHAGVSEATVGLWGDADTLTVRVQDAGGGFDPTETRTSIGLAGMQERAALLAGQLHIESRPGQGTCITAEFPCPSDLPSARSEPPR
jgi:signal transduction histidine kinase